MQQHGRTFSADRIGSLVWLLFGAVVLYGSWTMDRLEALGINPVTAPGLLPGLVGLGFIGLGLIMLLRRGAPQATEGAAAEATDWRRLALSYGLCVGFAGVLLGRGLPFWPLCAAFVFLHIFLIDDPERVAGQAPLRRAALAAVIAVATASVVTLVFQRVFLIRLP